MKTDMRTNGHCRLRTRNTHYSRHNRSAYGIALLFTVVVGARTAGANATTYSYECNNNWSGKNGQPVCPRGGDLVNRCLNGQNMAGNFNEWGWTRIQPWENNGWYDTDAIESDVPGPPYGGDTFWTDTPSSGLELWSSHCGDPLGGVNLHGYCNNDGDCAAGDKCYFLNSAHRCASFGWGTLETCSSGDTNGHYTPLSGPKIRFGESSMTNGWPGVGLNGNLNYAVFDCCGPFMLHFLGNYSQMFAGIHVIASYAGYLGHWPSTTAGTMWDSPSRGAYLAQRMLNGQPMAQAHIMSGEYDEPSGFQHNICTVVISCAVSPDAAAYHLDSEPPNSGDALDEPAPPEICENRSWCHFE